MPTLVLASILQGHLRTHATYRLSDMKQIRFHSTGAPELIRSPIRYYARDHAIERA